MVRGPIDTMRVLPGACLSNNFCERYALLHECHSNWKFETVIAGFFLTVFFLTETTQQTHTMHNMSVFVCILQADDEQYHKFPCTFIEVSSNLSSIVQTFPSQFLRL